MTPNLCTRNIVQLKFYAEAAYNESKSAAAKLNYVYGDSAKGQVVQKVKRFRQHVM